MTSGSSTARRSGPHRATTPTGSSCCAAPIPTVRKQAGISFLLCPIDQPGVEVRPIVNASRHHDFNEVFFTDAARPRRTWSAGSTTAGRSPTRCWPMSGRRCAPARDPTRRRARPADRRGPGTGQARRSGDPPALGLVLTPRSRSCATRVCEWSPTPSTVITKGPESSLNKLLWSEYHQKLTELALDIIGAEAMARRSRCRHRGRHGRRRQPLLIGRLGHHVHGSPPGTIYSGSSEVQRNIVGERVLACPESLATTPAHGTRPFDPEGYQRVTASA